MQPGEKLSIETCRKLLGSSGATMTDDQIEHLRDQIYVLANSFFDDIAERDKAEVRWHSWMLKATPEDALKLTRNEMFELMVSDSEFRRCLDQLRAGKESE
jgi:hypothetical protein